MALHKGKQIKLQPRPLFCKKVPFHNRISIDPGSNNACGLNQFSRCPSSDMEIEIFKLKSQLQKHIQDKEALVIIKELENITVNPEVLKKTKIGTYIKSIQTDELKPHCEKLILKWRKDISNGMLQTKNSSADSMSAKSTDRTFQTDVKQDLNLPEIRLKTVQFIYNALVLEDAKMELLLAISMNIEIELYKTFPGTLYKEKMRSLYLNLKVNEKLRQSILLEEVKPSILVNMSSEELAADHIKKINAEQKEKEMLHSMEATAQHASTDQFKCGKCKQRKCTYYQMQTRSADEPMTTFVTCTNCGNRWKFC
eukprot:NODE_417_length_8973_cov_0.852941.p3 type:complete len:311 gc:universal NODE_417_length_8973_cov_0.852941:5222-6154(+)